MTTEKKIIGWAEGMILRRCNLVPTEISHLVISDGERSSIACDKGMSLTAGQADKISSPGLKVCGKCRRIFKAMQKGGAEK